MTKCKWCGRENCNKVNKYCLGKQTDKLHDDLVREKLIRLGEMDKDGNWIR